MPLQVSAGACSGQCKAINPQRLVCLVQDPSYRAAVARRFAELRATGWSDAEVSGLFDSLPPLLKAAGVRTITK